MDSILLDLRYAARALVRRPALVTVASLSLAVGIGANTTIWSAVDQLLVRPLPLPHAHRVLQIYGTNQERGWNQTRFSRMNLEDLRDRATTIRLTGFAEGEASVVAPRGSAGGSNTPERLPALQTTSEYLEVAGARPALGRWLQRDDERSGAAPVAVISHEYWQRTTAGDRSVIGRALSIDGRQHEIVGVLPEGFWFRDRRAQIWTPLHDDPEADRASTWILVAGRLLPGQDAAAATSELSRLAVQLVSEHATANEGLGIRTVPLREDLVDSQSRQAAKISAVAVAFVLLIACANVANLLLADATSRTSEVAVRQAMGASRSRLVRLYLNEAVLLALIGGVAGLAVALLGTRALQRVLMESGQLHSPLRLDGRMLLFTLACSLSTGVVFGLVPALQTVRRRAPRLSVGRSAALSAARSPLRRGLVICEVALSLALLVSSALLVQASRHLARVDLGLDAGDVQTLRVSLPESQFPDDEQRSRMFQRLRTEFAEIPAVDTAAAISILPGTAYSATYYGPPGGEGPTSAVAEYRAVTPDYFATLDIPVLSGQSFPPPTAEEDSNAVIINRALAELHWPNGNPIGEQLDFPFGARTITGVVGDSRDGGANSEFFPVIFFPTTATAPSSLAFVLETDLDTAALLPAVRSRLHALDPTLALDHLRPMTDIFDEDIAGDTVLSRIFASVAAIALILALGGVYGLVSFWVGLRMPEFGVRMALGADRRRATADVLRHGLSLALVGIVVGLALAAAAARLLSGFLFGLDPLNPMVFGGSAAALVLAVLAASWLPARRAGSVDPAVVLRDG